MYIRTKDGVYEVEWNSCVEMWCDVKTHRGFILDSMISKVDYKLSENIEELCDRFIFHYQRIIDNKVVDNFHREFWFLWQAKETFDNCKIESKEIKGAIYTDKGLTYVANMNSEGKLVLI